MVQDTLSQALDLPYSVFESGPYDPPCQEERVAYSTSLGLTNSPPPDPEVPQLSGGTPCADALSGPVAICAPCLESRPALWELSKLVSSAPGTVVRSFCGGCLAH